MQRVKEIHSPIGAVKKYIVSTVGEKYISTISYGSTVHEMLTALKKRVKPTTQSVKSDLKSQYEAVHTYDFNTPLENWLTEWETVYHDAKELNLAFTVDRDAERQFLQSIHEIAPSYAANV